MDEIKLAHNDWYNEIIDNILTQLKTNITGLKDEEAKKRLDEFGPNELKEKKAVSPLILLLEQFKDFLIIILGIAAIISGVQGDWLEAIAIIIIVILAGVLGFLQEYEAEKAIDSLKKMAAPTATTLRDGIEKNYYFLLFYYFL